MDLGFGLRLWASKSGGRKAYAIRVTDNSGKSVRQTYDPLDQQFWPAVLYLDEDMFPAALEDAREWASKQIKRCKHPEFYKEPSIESKQNYQRFVDATLALPLGRACNSVLLRGKMRGGMQSYLDRLEHAKFYISHEYAEQPLALVDVEKLLSDIKRLDISDSVRGDIQSLVRQAYDQAAHIAPRLWGRRRKISKVIREQKRADRNILNETLLCDGNMPAKLVHYLLGEPDHWQQALCIALAIESYLPISVVKRSKWSQVDAVTGVWYPYSPKQRPHWRAYGYRLEKRSEPIYTKLRSQALSLDDQSPYMFPSPTKPDTPIASLETMRKALLHHFELPNISIKSLVDECKKVGLQNIIIDW